MFPYVADGSCSVNLVDILGKVVMMDNKNAVEGQNQYQYSFEKLASGIYTLIIQQEETTMHTRVVKE